MLLLLATSGEGEVTPVTPAAAELAAPAHTPAAFRPPIGGSLQRLMLVVVQVWVVVGGGVCLGRPQAGA
eukprot:scaffold103077_cov18-Tisochrysis_lutea.AAC.3